MATAISIFLGWVCDQPPKALALGDGEVARPFARLTDRQLLLTDQPFERKTREAFVPVNCRVAFAQRDHHIDTEG